MKKLIIMLIGFSALIAPMSMTYAVGEDITGPDVVFKQADKILTITNILELYSSELGEIEVTSDAYTGYGDVPGNYAVTLAVSETEVTKDISVNVRQTIGPVIAVTVTAGSYEIILHKNTTLTANQIIDVLINVQYIVVTSSTQITVLTNTYTANASAPGNYTFEFYLATTSGVEETYLVTLQVNDTETLNPDIVLDEPADTVAATMHPIAKAGSIALVISATVALLAFVGSKITKKRGRKR
jgi:hypothetical protein